MIIIVDDGVSCCTEKGVPYNCTGLCVLVETRTIQSNMRRNNIEYDYDYFDYGLCSEFDAIAQCHSGKYLLRDALC